MRTLVICEKNDAAKQIAQILGGGKQKRRLGGGVPVYEIEDWDGGPTDVMGLRGHILETDFVEGHKRWSIQEEKLHGLVDADVVKSPTEAKIIATLKQRGKRADRVIVATDYDREGELIGVEALEAMGDVLEGKEVVRAKYSSFTKAEVQKAFSELTDVDRAMAAAGEARQVIDLAWGAALTRYVSVVGGRRGREFLSVGRVQTPTLGLIVDREKERLSFQDDPFWEVTADLEGSGEEGAIRFQSAHVRNGFVSTKEGRFDHYGDHFKSQDEAEAARKAIEAAGQATVTSVTPSERKVRAPIPFSTTGFQQAASGIGFGVKRAMDIAQKLYLGGFISYHRTENTVYPDSLELGELVDTLAASGPIQNEADWVKQNRRDTPTRGKKETKDHPPIYPTGVPGIDAKLSDPERRVWELVARRFLATLSPDARVHQVQARFESGGETLKASGQTTVFAGWRHVMGPFFKGKETPLPALEEGQVLPVLDAALEAKVTQPPKRYGQGGLIAEMEKLGIGTKATRHETIQKLIDRNYITEDPVQPTLVGFAVTDALEQYARRVTEPEMTHRLEDEMTQIEQGQRTFDQTIEDSRTLLHEVVSTLLQNKDAIQPIVRKALEEDAHVGTCPRCGEKLLQRSNRFGGRFVGCKGYPDCEQTYNLPARGRIEWRDEPCDECGAPFVTVNERGKVTSRCLDGECPSNAEAAQEEAMTIGPCPACKAGTLHSTKSRNWKRYVVCDNADCDQTYPLPQRGAIHVPGQSCETCGAPRIHVINKNRKPWDICINMDCPSKEEADKKGKKGKAKAA